MRAHEIVGGGERVVQLKRRLVGGVPTQRQGVAHRRLVVVADALERGLPHPRRVGFGDLGGVEAGAQQELAVIRDEVANRADLALEAVTLAQQPGEREAAAIGEGRERDGNRPGIASGGGGKHAVIGRRLEYRGNVFRIGDERRRGKINQCHREPP